MVSSILFLISGGIAIEMDFMESNLRYGLNPIDLIIGRLQCYRRNGTALTVRRQVFLQPPAGYPALS